MIIYNKKVISIEINEEEREALETAKEILSEITLAIKNCNNDDDIELQYEYSEDKGLIEDIASDGYWVYQII